MMSNTMFVWYFIEGAIPSKTLIQKKIFLYQGMDGYSHKIDAEYKVSPYILPLVLMLVLLSE